LQASWRLFDVLRSDVLDASRTISKPVLASLRRGSFQVLFALPDNAKLTREYVLRIKSNVGFRLVSLAFGVDAYFVSRNVGAHARKPAAPSCARAATGEKSRSGRARECASTNVVPTQERTPASAPKRAKIFL